VALKGDKLRGGLDRVKAENLSLLRSGIDQLRKTAQYKEAVNHKLTISRSAALLLLWEVSVNLCKYAKTWVKFSVDAGDPDKLIIKIESDRDPSKVDGGGPSTGLPSRSTRESLSDESNIRLQYLGH
jgi:hypothetical protein